MTDTLTRVQNPAYSSAAFFFRNLLKAKLPSSDDLFPIILA